MNGAIIGFGNIAQGHMYAYQLLKIMQITSVVDCFEERRNYAKKVYPTINVYATIEELFLEQKVDFIDICTPPNTHFQYIKEGLLADCHVLCEKPFLINSEQYSELVHLIHTSGKCVYPSHNYKFAPVIKLMNEHISSASFGEVKRGHFRTLRRGHAVGVLGWNPNWRNIPEFSFGGIVCDHGPHNIYLACDMLKRYPIAVSCIAGNLNQVNMNSHAEDTALLTLYFDNDVQILIDLSWAANYRYTCYSMVGSCQSIFVENDKMCISDDGVFKNVEVVSEFDDSLHKAWFCDMFRDFLNLLEIRERQTALLQEAFTVTLVIEKAYESASKRGEIIKLSNAFLPQNGNFR